MGASCCSDRVGVCSRVTVLALSFLAFGASCFSDRVGVSTLFKVLPLSFLMFVLGVTGRATPEGAPGGDEDGRFCLTVLCGRTSFAGRLRRPYLGISDMSDILRCVALLLLVRLALFVVVRTRSVKSSQKTKKYSAPFSLCSPALLFAHCA